MSEFTTTLFWRCLGLTTLALSVVARNASATTEYCCFGEPPTDIVGALASSFFFRSLLIMTAMALGFAAAWTERRFLQRALKVLMIATFVAVVACFVRANSAFVSGATF